MSSVQSPCTNICRIHPDTGWCEGCARSIEEIIAWGKASDPLKLQILAQLPPRRERLVALGIFTAAEHQDMP